MAWINLNTITPTTRWQFTKPTNALFFRLKHIDSPLEPYLWICQADIAGDIQLADIKELPREFATQIIRLDNPKVFPSTRAIGIKSNTETSRWRVEIENSDYVEPTSGTTTTPTPTTGYSSTVVAPLGSAGMQQIINGSVDDGSVTVGDIGFDFPFYAATYRSNINVSSNGYVTFGYASTAYSSLSLTNPGRGLFVAAADRSYQQVFIKADNPGTSFRIRYEGSSSTNGDVGNPGMVWEVTLFRDGTIQLATGRLDATIGQSTLTDGTGTYFTNYALAANTSFVFQKTATSYTVSTGSYTLEKL